jgi:hypothetical protein
MRTISIISILILFIVPIKAQKKSQIKLPEPLDGWTPITSKMIYPELARRAGVNATYKVSVIVDSTGKQENLNFKIMDWPEHCMFDSLFSDVINKSFSATKWHSGTRDGVPTTMKISFLLSLSQSGGGTVSMDGSTINYELSTKIKIDSISRSY